MVSKWRDSKYCSGPSSNWLKAKCYTIDEFDLRRAGKPAFALMAERGTGRYVGSAFITLNREMRQRLWKRVPTKGQAGIIGRVERLRGEEDLRHASLQDFRQEGT